MGMSQTRGVTVNKAVLTILFLAACLAGLPAQPAQPGPTNAAGAKPRSTNDPATQQAVRALLERIYGEHAKTEPTARDPRN